MNYDHRAGSRHPSSYSMYPVVQLQGQPGNAAPVPRPVQSTTSSGAVLGVRVTIKPDCWINPPPPLSPTMVDIPRSNFQFNFDFERKILAEAHKDSQNWSRITAEYIPQRASESHPSPRPGPREDPIVSKYVASGLSREAVPYAVAAYGDNPTKVREFVNGYTLLREMGFSSSSIAEALILYENDTDKALAHFLNGSS